jgi:hypothetical protein
LHVRKAAGDRGGGRAIGQAIRRVYRHATALVSDIKVIYLIER